jgi:hypothetical protein
VTSAANMYGSRENITSAARDYFVAMAQEQR